MTAKHIVNVVAIADQMPPKRDTLRVIATIRANKGQTASLKIPASPGINPKILILDVEIAGRGAEPTEIEAAYEDSNYGGQYDQVTVRYMSEMETVEIQKPQ